MQQVSRELRQPLAEVPCGDYACGQEFLLCLTTDAPYIFDGKALQGFLPFLVGVDDTYAVVGRVLLGVLAGNLGECFGGCLSAGYRYAHPLADLQDHLLVIGFEFVHRHVITMQKGLIDGVLIQSWRVLGKYAHYSAAQVAV